MLDNIRNSLSCELNILSTKFNNLVESDFYALKDISEYVFNNSGKQLRPILLFLTYRLFKETLSEKAYTSAALIELVHSASLMHDDVVDMADNRRGKATVRSLWGNKTAILAGDYMLSNAFLKAYETNDVDFIAYLMDTVKQMSEGELIQLEYIKNEKITEDIYFKIINRKTAALFSCCCKSAAFAANATEEQIKICGEIGKYIGLAFQIKDDLLDVDKNAKSGKNYGNDIIEGKITLPTLYFLQNCSDIEKRDFWRDFINGKNTEALVELIGRDEIIQLCKNRINYFYKKAENLIDSLNIDCKSESYNIFKKILSIIAT